MKKVTIKFLIIVCVCSVFHFATPVFAHDGESHSTSHSPTEHNALIQQLMKQVAMLQTLLQQLLAQQKAPTTVNSGVWQSTPGTVVNNKGPQKNVMNCEGGTEGSLANGSLACYGLHDYGGEFGDDQANCGGLDPDYEKRVPTGCVIPAPTCKSDRAIATDYYRITAASPQKISELAKNFKSNETAVREQLIRIWEYRCTDKPLTGLSSTIDQSQISENFGGKNPDWSFVDSAADVLVVGVYEGDQDDGSVDVEVSSANPGSLLVLAAYDPVTWNLSGSALKNIKAIFVTGYENQSVTGVPEGVKITSSVYEAGQRDHFFYVYERDSVEYYELMNYLRAKTGYTPYLFFGDYQLSKVNVSIKG